MLVYVSAFLFRRPYVTTTQQAMPSSKPGMPWSRSAALPKTSIPRLFSSTPMFALTFASAK